MSTTAGAIRVGQINAAIRVQLKEGGAPMDLSQATVKRFKFKKRTGLAIEAEAPFATDGTDGVIEYFTISADEIDVAGPWTGQPYIENGSDHFHGSIFSF